MSGLSLVTKGMITRTTKIQQVMGGGGIIKDKEDLPKPLILISKVNIKDTNGKRKKKQSESILIKTKSVKID